MSMRNGSDMTTRVISSNCLSGACAGRTKRRVSVTGTGLMRKRSGWLAGCGGVGQDHGQGECAEAVIAIADLDFDGAATVEAQETREVLMRFHGERDEGGGVDVDRERAAVADVGMRAGVLAGRLEIPVGAVEAENHRLAEARVARHGVAHRDRAGEADTASAHGNSASAGADTNRKHAPNDMSAALDGYESIVLWPEPPKKEIIAPVPLAPVQSPQRH